VANNSSRITPLAALPARWYRTAIALVYGAEVVAALAFCWAVLGAPTGKRLAPMMADLVPRLRRFEELQVSEVTASALNVMSPATMDRRLASERAKLVLRGRSHTKPGSLLKDSIPIRTWPSGTTRARGSSRSTWSVTRAAARWESTATP